jgi:hypothetical protein
VLFVMIALIMLRTRVAALRLREELAPPEELGPAAGLRPEVAR